MGLDMYFNKMKIVDGYSIRQCANAPYYYDKLNSDIDDELHKFELTMEDVRKLQTMGVEKPEDVAYFRKFNALHNWIVDNIIEDGEDNVTYYEVDKSSLKQMLSDLQEVRDSIELLPFKKTRQYEELDNRVKEQFENLEDDYKWVNDISVCKEKLPTTSGFFFGSTIYDMWYAQDVEDALEQLGKVSLNDDEILTYYAWY